MEAGDSFSNDSMIGALGSKVSKYGEQDARGVSGLVVEKPGSSANVLITFFFAANDARIHFGDALISRSL